MASTVVADEDGEYGDDLEQSTPDIEGLGWLNVPNVECSDVRMTDG